MNIQSATTKPLSTRRQRRKSDTATRILDAAEEMLASRGYQHARMDEIAEHADVAVGTLYTYFNSKENLYRAVVNRAIESDQAFMDRAQVSSDDPVEQLTAVAEEYRALVRQHPLIFRLGLGLERELLDALPEIATRLAERHRAEVERLAAVIEKGVRRGVLRDVDAKLTATFLEAAWRGVTGLHLRRDDLGLSDDQFEAVLAQGVALASHGLLTTSRSTSPIPSAITRDRPPG